MVRFIRSNFDFTDINNFLPCEKSKRGKNGQYQTDYYNNDSCFFHLYIIFNGQVVYILQCVNKFVNLVLCFAKSYLESAKHFFFFAVC